MPAAKTLRTCPRGHRYVKSSDCPTCPQCEAAKKPASGFLAALGAPAFRALQHEGLTTLKKLSARSERELLALHGMGPASLPVLRAALKAEGLSFREAEPVKASRGMGMYRIDADTPEAYVAALDGWRSDVVKALRKAVRAAAPLEEGLKWGHLVYLSNGPALLIRAEAARVLFGFWRGKRLREIEPGLKPGGKYEMATLELREGEKLPSAATVKKLVKAAVALNAKGGSPQAAAPNERGGNPQAQAQAAGDLPTLAFAAPSEFEKWMSRHHASAGLWIKVAKKESGIPSITCEQALDVALSHGWIDGQRKGLDARHFLQKYTPRRARSLWSRRNIAKVAALKAAGKMKPGGLAQVEAAQKDGRWDAAYGSSKEMVVPEDFLKAVRKSKKAKAAFEALNAAGRFSVSFRLHTAKKPETRARRMTAMLAMLETGTFK